MCVPGGRGTPAVAQPVSLQGACRPSATGGPYRLLRVLTTGLHVQLALVQRVVQVLAVGEVVAVLLHALLELVGLLGARLLLLLSVRLLLRLPAGRRRRLLLLLLGRRLVVAAAERAGRGADSTAETQRGAIGCVRRRGRFCQSRKPGCIWAIRARTGARLRFPCRKPCPARSCFRCRRACHLPRGEAGRGEAGTESRENGAGKRGGRLARHAEVDAPPWDCCGAAGGAADGLVAGAGLRGSRGPRGRVRAGRRVLGVGIRHERGRPRGLRRLCWLRLPREHARARRARRCCGTRRARGERAATSKAHSAAARTRRLAARKKAARAARTTTTTANDDGQHVGGRGAARNSHRPMLLR